MSALKALSKKSDWLQEVLRGAQQVLVDELALGVAGDAGVDLRWLGDLRRDVSMAAGTSAEQHE